MSKVLCSPMSVEQPSMDLMDRGEDGTAWRIGWYCKEGPRPGRIRRQQGRGGVMFSGCNHWYHTGCTIQSLRWS